jgi:hypothetical protein
MVLVGQFAHWVVAKGPAKSIRTAGLTPTDKSVARGWRYGEGDGIPDDLDALVADLAADVRGPVVGAWVADSDVAYVVATAPGFDAARLVFNAPRAESDWKLPPTTSESIDAFAEWSRAFAPRPLDPPALAELVRRNTTFAEEGIFDLLAALGLDAEYDERRPPDDPQPAPSLAELGALELGGYRVPLRHMWHSHHLGGRVYRPWRELRYLPGLGEGFIGIWDRHAPDAPADRFPRSYSGEGAALERLDTLLMPDVLREHRLDELAGYEATLLAFDQLDPGYRSIEPCDARFVFGRGAGFVGVWDRERPGAAIERFRDTDTGRFRAQQRADELLLDTLAESVTLTGIREYAPARASGVADQPTAFLLVEEEPHPTWTPILPLTGGAVHAYLVWPRGLHHYGGGSREHAGRILATWGAVDFEPVPDAVPRTLAATARWVAERS